MRRGLGTVLAFFLVPAFIALAQEESPFIVVAEPHVSLTAFTNWQLIEIVYTIGYMDGYEPLDDLAKPDGGYIAFAPLEVDPELGRQLIVRNKRKRGVENYQDYVYYLRHIGENKGDLVISPQMFHYVCRICDPGKSLEQLEVRNIKSFPVVIKYSSVLLQKPVEVDIKDEISFGSIKELEYFWKGLSLAGFLLILTCLALVIFKKPKEASRKESYPKVSDQYQNLGGTAIITPRDALLALKVQLKEISRLLENNLEINEAQFSLYNSIRNLLIANIDGALVSDTPSELKVKTLSIGGVKEGLLFELASTLEFYDGQFSRGTPIKWPQEVHILKSIVSNLEPARILMYETRIYIHHKRDSFKRAMKSMAARPGEIISRIYKRLR